METDGTGKDVETFPALLDAGAAEVVPTLDGHWVPQVIQADGAAGLCLQVGQRDCEGHCAGVSVSGHSSLRAGKSEKLMSPRFTLLCGRQQMLPRRVPATSRPTFLSASPSVFNALPPKLKVSREVVVVKTDTQCKSRMVSVDKRTLLFKGKFNQL